MLTKSMLVVATLCLCAGGAGAVEHRFDADGIELRYVIDGEGPLVVLLHGMSGSAEGAWIEPGTYDHLVASGYRVVALDQRGHGKSAKPHDPAAYGAEMAEDLRRLLDHLAVRRAHVVGYSMGAKVANTFRGAYPQRLLTVTLGGYGWPWQTPAMDLDSARAQLAARGVLPGNDLDALAAMLSRSNVLTPTAESLRENTVPALSIVGVDDHVVPRADVESLRGTMARIEARDMPGTHAGDDGALYKPGFAAAIAAFLARHAAE